ncbi:MAG: PIN domain-containing protein [Planctomycetaceae bacterium]
MVNRAVLLDAGPLGLATNPNRSPSNLACTRWLQELLAAGVQVLVPEIADYEVRRELLRAKKERGIAKLDALVSSLVYLPLTTAAVRKAAECWAEARQQGRQTASDQSLDADVLLAGQALTLGDEVIIATTNVGHLSRFVAAEEWHNIRVT